MNERFACFAPGWFINSDDEVYRAAWRRFYVAKSRPTEGDGWLRGSQLVLMTSTGRLLSGAVRSGDPHGLGPALREVLASYAKLPEAERRAGEVVGEMKPVPAPPPGGLVLTVYDRPLGRAGNGQYRLPIGNDLGGGRTDAPHGQRSSIWLTREECQALLPSVASPGEVHRLPTPLVRRLFLYSLWPQSLWVVEQSWKPDSVRRAELCLTVATVTERTLSARIRGEVLLSGMGPLKLYPTGQVLKTVENRFDARVEGVMEIDRATQTIRRWDMVALGDYAGCWFASKDGWKEASQTAPLPVGFAFEMDTEAYQLAPERRRPRSFVHAYIFRERDQFYWNPELWEADWQRSTRK